VATKVSLKWQAEGEGTVEGDAGGSATADAKYASEARPYWLDGKDRNKAKTASP